MEDKDPKEESGPSVLLMDGKEFLQELKKKEEIHFSLIGKPKVIITSISLNDLLEEVKVMLDEFADIIVDELPSNLPFF